MRSSDARLRLLLAKVVARQHLTEDESVAAFGQMISGHAAPVSIGALLAALQTKGLAPSEVAGGVRALREAMIPVRAPMAADLVDTCGTGGGSVSTFNISTAAALVVAAGGVRVAKHGNRSYTSRCGSADVLEEMGVVVQLSPQGMEEVLARTGIVFMYAPVLHPAMRHVAPVRRDLGITTIMNLLGPLTNPAGARRQVVGVADLAFLDVVAESLARLGHERALVVYGEPGMDEISPCGSTRVAELRGGKITRYEVDPEDFGLKRVAARALAGGAPAENAATVRAVLEGRNQGAARTAVLINAAAAFYVAGKVPGLPEGVDMGARMIDSGGASDVLAALARETHAVAR